MLLTLWKRIVFATLFLAVGLVAQPSKPPQTPTFDVVSIRLVPPNAPSVVRSQDFTAVLPGGQYVDSRAALIFMIGFAYKVKNLSKQLVGLPDWAKSQSFAVAAKSAPDLPALGDAENKEHVRLMLRNMLTDRFHLQVHTETRQQPIFNLTVAKGGMKIPQVGPPVAPAKEGPVNMALSALFPRCPNQSRLGWLG